MARPSARAADALHEIVTDPGIRAIVDHLIKVGPGLDEVARRKIARAVGLKEDLPR